MKIITEEKDIMQGVGSVDVLCTALNVSSSAHKRKQAICADIIWNGRVQELPSTGVRGS